MLALPQGVTLATARALSKVGAAVGDVAAAHAEDVVDLPALRGKGYGKSVKVYPDYVLKENGLQYKDIRLGEGALVQRGDRVVVDWDAFAIGSKGATVQAKNLAKGGDFEGSDVGFLRFTLGGEEMIAGFQDAMEGMREGGIRRVVVPPGPLSYPEGTGFKKVGPKPTSFGGKRTLDFVLRNENSFVDKTLLFDIELLGIGADAKARRAPGTWVADVMK